MIARLATASSSRPRSGLLARDRAWMAEQPGSAAATTARAEDGRALSLTMWQDDDGARRRRTRPSRRQRARHGRISSDSQLTVRAVTVAAVF